MTIRVAWLTHRPWDATKGGAEACDVDMVGRKPKEVEVTLILPGGVDDDLPDFDKVVVSGFHKFSARELNRVQDVGHKTTLWNHDVSMEGHWLLEAVTNIIFSSEFHKDYELAKQSAVDEKRKNIFINPGWMDITQFSLFQPDRREGALWAHRPVEHKGLQLAADWANENDEKLTVMVGRPRSEVLRAMTQHKKFVLLPYLPDAAPRAVMEAYILGCKPVINENVGVFDEPVDQLLDRLDRADTEFWETVLN